MDEKPSKNASKADWTEYALAHGKTEDDLEGLGRNDIAELFADEDGDGAEVTGASAAEAAYEAGEAMTAKDAPAPVKTGAEDLPPHLRAAAVHRAVTKK